MLLCIVLQEIMLPFVQKVPLDFCTKGTIGLLYKRYHWTGTILQVNYLLKIPHLSCHGNHYLHHKHTIWKRISCFGTETGSNGILDMLKSKLNIIFLEFYKVYNIYEVFKCFLGVSLLRIRYIISLCLFTYMYDNLNDTYCSWLRQIHQGSPHRDHTSRH